MRYLVFGDVHGNLDALDAVLAAGKARGVDGYLCVGDVVGYGPNPIECLDRLWELHRRGLLAWVAGNHELAVRDEVDWQYYTPEAVATLQWTQEQLAKMPWARRFVEEAELTLAVNDDIYLTHDSIAEPSSGLYHRTPHNAVHELYTLTEKGGRIGFYGHTHAQRAEVFENHNIILAPMNAHTGTEDDPHPLRLAAGQAGWVGTGSVGFPKTRERHAEYLIFDKGQWQVEKYAAPYSRDKAKTRTREVLAPVCGAAVAERIALWL
jgi:predicted phosphodiesterase